MGNAKVVFLIQRQLSIGKFVCQFRVFTKTNWDKLVALACMREAINNTIRDIFFKVL